MDQPSLRTLAKSQAFLLLPPECTTTVVIHSYAGAGGMADELHFAHAFIGG